MNPEDKANRSQGGTAVDNREADFERGFAEGFQTGFRSGTEQSGKGGEKKGGEKEEDKKDGEKNRERRPVYKRPIFIVIAVAVTVAILTGLVVMWLIARQYVSTDDAYIDGYVTQVSPRVAALVETLHVQDNQYVHKGDLLVELDPTDYQVALNEATAQVTASEGQLKQAQAQVETAQASVGQAAAEVDAAQVQLDNATRDLKRYQDVDERARSRQQLDNAETAQRNAAARLKQAQAQKASAEANVQSAEASVAAAGGQLQTAKANRERAEVNLSYCKIFAPADGRVTQRTVSVGNYTGIGQAMFMLADPRVWVTANYKETQLTHMRTGQPVTVSVDAYPGIKWRAHVDSIQAGSGSRFSILPAENATGNFVKVVQRVPVKIVFDEPVNTNNDVLLSAGLSVIPRVKIR